MKYHLLLTLLMITSITSAQTSWYVSQSIGADSNDGLSSSTPFETFDAAQISVVPGDTIFIMGEYHNLSYDPNYTFTGADDSQLWHQENSIKIYNLHGTSGNYITIKPYNSSTILKGDGANIFRIQSASYLRIEGLEIMGEVNNIPLSTAEALQFAYIDKDNVVDEFAPTSAEINFRDQDCVSNCTAGSVVDGEVYSDISNLNIGRPSYTDTRGLYISEVHHIDIVNNLIHHMPGGGLRVADCEDINIIGNEIHNCSRKSYSGTHALVVTKATSTRATDDYRVNILKNKVHFNYNEIYSWSPSKTIINPHIDEGKGISLQRNETIHNDDGSISLDWENGRILVANNICYYNGFSGVHSNDGNRIDIINNTCYFNSYTQSITLGITSNNGGNIGISAQGGYDVQIKNNISVIDGGLSKSAISTNLSVSDSLVVTNNIIYGTTGNINQDADVVAVQVNTVMTDPLFTDVNTYDFSLQSTSPAINLAGVTDAPSDDYFSRSRDGQPDLGAIEAVSVVPITLHTFEVNLINEDQVHFVWMTLTEEHNDFFTIEHSTDGINWNVLTHIQGQGFSNTPTTYESYDFNPQYGTSYYRLKQTDFDGQCTYSLIKSIYIDFVQPNSFTIFPNPTSDFLHVQTNVIESLDFRIYNSLGVDFTSKIRIVQPSIIDITALPIGFYYVYSANQIHPFQIVR